MSEHEVYRLTDLLGEHQEMISKKQTGVRKKLVILQSIGIIVINSKETRVITYTCRYSSGLFNPYNSVMSG